MVARLDGGDPRTDRLDDASSLVSEDDGESTLGVLAREGVCIYIVSDCCFLFLRRGCNRTCVADTSVVDLNADLVGLGRSDLDILDGQRLSGFPCYSSLAWSQ